VKKLLILFLYIFGFVGLGFSQYSQPSEQTEMIYKKTKRKHYIYYRNIKYNNTEEFNEIAKTLKKPSKHSVFNKDSTIRSEKIIATGLGYSKVPNNVALTLLVISGNKKSVIRGTYVSLSLDDDKKFVSTINLVLYGVNINTVHHVKIYPVIGINLYHVSVKLTPEEYYMIYQKDPGNLEEGDGTIWDYDMTYSLTFGVITTFRIGNQIFGVPMTFTKYGISTVGILIKINRK
jgi:hypothetical protein